LSGCGKRDEPVAVSVPAVERAAVVTFDASTGNPRPGAPRPEDPRQPEPRAVAARARVIQRDADAILAECRQAAGGDWDRWQKNTARYRDALKTKVSSLKVFEKPPAPYHEAQSEPLAGRDNFPLFEVAPPVFLRFLFEPESLDSFRKDRAVVAVDRWLKARGIDLIFIAVPKLTEVYIEHFLNDCPPDGIIAPHVRRILFDLLKEDVEVVDGFPSLRRLRDTDKEYLFNTADAHWAPRGMRIIAKEVGDRIARYKFGSRARYGLPIVKTAPGRHPIPGIPVGGELQGDMTAQFGWSALTPEQRKLAQPAQATSLAHVTMLDDSEPPDDPKSPVVLVGNSYVPLFREQLIKELNMLIRSDWKASATTEMFEDFLRDPSALDHCRVLIWVMSEKHMADFKPLPAAIAKAGQEK
jgi:hypothetical protein